MSRGTPPKEHTPDYPTYPANKEAGIVENTRLESPSTAVQNFPNRETSVWESLSSRQVSRPQPKLDYLGVGLAAKDDGSRC